MDWYFQVISKYAVFNGRARRKEFWMFSLVNFVLVMFLELIQFVLQIGLTRQAADSDRSMVAGVLLCVAGLLFIYSMGLLIPSLAVTVRRLHDTGRSGWNYFIGLIPIVGGIILLIYLCEDSQPGMNLYGPNPKEAQNLQTQAYPQASYR